MGTFFPECDRSAEEETPGPKSAGGASFPCAPSSVDVTLHQATQKNLAQILETGLSRTLHKAGGSQTDC